MTPLRVVSIEIRDVLGARELAIEPGKVTVLSGRNGSGKSSALGAVQAALGRGNLAKLARVDGSEDTEPEVVLVVEGGGEQYRVERQADALRVRKRVGDSAAFEDVSKPQAFISGLVDERGANPVAFLQAADKDRALMLLEALPLRLDQAALQAALEGVPRDAVPAIPRGLHPLEHVELVRSGIFSARTGVNRDAKNAAAAVDQLQRSVPAEMPEDPGAELLAASDAVSVRAAEIATAREAAARTRDAAVLSAANSYKAASARLRAAHEAYAAELRAEVEKLVADAYEGTQRQIAAAETERRATEAEANEVTAEARRLLALQEAGLSEQRERVVALQAEVKRAAEVGALRRQIETFESQRSEHAALAATMTAALGRIDELRRSLADSLPIPGLSISGREVRVGGVLFDQLNTAQRVAIAVKVACLRAASQRLPVLFVDGAECLDAEHFAALVAELGQQSIQAFLARVTDGDLTIRTDAA